MRVEGNKSIEGGEGRRFTPSRPTNSTDSIDKGGRKSFAASLRRAQAAPGNAPAGPPEGKGPSAPGPSAAANASAGTGAEDAGSRPAIAPSGSGTALDGGAADPQAAFADHMEMVRFRLQTGYYTSKAIEDALSDKLSGYFDDLA